LYIKCANAIKINISFRKPLEYGMLLKAIAQPLVNAKKGLGNPLGYSQRRLESLWTIFRRYWTAVRKCPGNIVTRWANNPIGWSGWKLLKLRLSANKVEGRIAQRLSAKT
jgi:hypothetical protein